jgi:Flp pilus assembly protein TadG
MQQTKLHDEHGQSVILIALVMIVLIAFLGLIIDGGEAYLNRRDSQDAADAGAFAGVRILALHNSNSTPSNISQAINAFASANKVIAQTQNVLAYFIDANGNQIGNSSQTISTYGTVPPEATGVIVTTTITYTTAFIGVLGANGTVPIRARAAAQSGPPAGISNLMPMAIPLPVTTTYPYSPTLTILAGDGSVTGSGNYEWLDFGLTSCAGQGGANIVSGMIQIPQACSAPYVPLPSWVGSKTGYGISQIASAIDQWLALSIPQRHWFIPVYDCYGQNQVCGTGSGTNVDYHVVHFADFIPMGYWFGNGNGKSGGSLAGAPGCPQSNLPPFSTPNKCVVGYFVQFAVPSPVGTPGACNTNPSNGCAISLTQ